MKECNQNCAKINPEESLSIADEYIHKSKFRFNERVVKIEYSDERLKSLVDPKFNHLKCNENEETTFKIVEKNRPNGLLFFLNSPEKNISPLILPMVMLKLDELLSEFRRFSRKRRNI